MQKSPQLFNQWKWALYIKIKWLFIDVIFWKCFINQRPWSLYKYNRSKFLLLLRRDNLLRHRITPTVLTPTLFYSDSLYSDSFYSDIELLRHFLLRHIITPSCIPQGKLITISQVPLFIRQLYGDGLGAGWFRENWQHQNYSVGGGGGAVGRRATMRKSTVTGNADDVCEYAAS